MRKTSYFLTFAIILISTLHFSFNHVAGNGGDSDPKTFHFMPDNKNRQLAKSDNTTPLGNSEVLTLFNQNDGISVKIDGCEIYTPTGGCISYGYTFAADSSGISDTKWLSASFPAVSNVRIDTTRGRIKFNPAPNFKFQPGVGFATSFDATAPILMRMETYKAGASETIVAVVLGKISGVYNYMTFSLPSGSSPNENIADFTGSSGYTVAGPTIMTGMTNCTELVSDTDIKAAASSAVFAAYCDSGAAGKYFAWQYNGAFTLNTATFTNGGLTAVAPQSPKIYNRHIDAAVNGTAFEYAWMTQDAGVGMSNKPLVNFTGVGTKTKSEQANVALTSRCMDIKTPISTTNDSRLEEAFDPSIDCSNGTCYVAYVQQINTYDAYTSCTITPDNLEQHIMAFNIDTVASGNAQHSLTLPVDKSGDEKSRPEIVAINANSAIIAYYWHEVNNLAIPKLKVTYFFNGKWLQDANYIGTLGSNVYQETLLSETAILTSPRQLTAKLGQGDNVYFVWTQNEGSSYPGNKGTNTAGRISADANTVYIKEWRYGNIASDKSLSFSTIKSTSPESGALTSFNWTPFRNGDAFMSFSQGGNLYLNKFNSSAATISMNDIDTANALPSQNHLTHPLGNVSALTYSSYPKPTGKRLAFGRTVALWAETSGANYTIFSRSYYDKVNIEVSYNAQQYGTVLTPDGFKPPLVRNNYSRPGDSKPVEIFINDRKATETVNVAIYTIDGKLVKTLINNKLYNSFRQPVKWDKRTSAGNLVGSGVYQVYITTSGGYKANHPIVIVR